MRLDTFFFFSFLKKKKKKKKKKDNIFLPLKKNVNEKCGRPTGHNFGHPLDRKQNFFYEQTKGHDTSSNSTVESGRVETGWLMCHRVTTRFFSFILVLFYLVGSRPPYDSTVELGWLMCHGLKSVIFLTFNIPH